MLAFSLLRAVELLKRGIASIPVASRTKAQNASMDFFSQRGSTFLLTSAVSDASETYLGKVVADPFDLHFVSGVSLSEAIKLWTPIVTIALALNSTLSGALERNLRTKERVVDALERFSALFEATKEANAPTFENFSKYVEIS